MKILERHETFKEWKLEVSCDSVDGFSCGSKLEINKEDLKYKIIDGVVIHGVICPVCGNFIEIAPNLIPGIVKNNL